MADARQDEHGPLYIREVHNCPAVWDVLTDVVNKDTKNKRNKMEELTDKLGLVQTFLFLHCFYSTKYVGYVAKLPCAVTLRAFANFFCQHKFATLVCCVKKRF